MHLSAHSLTCIEELALATVFEYAMLGFAAAGRNTEVEEHLARAAAVNALEISAMCVGAT